jgi:hypothetical protein
MAEVCDPAGIGRCVDTACGDGSLLTAARDVFAGIQCIGIDVDGSAIARLKRKHPTWILSQANALSDISWKRAYAARRSIGCELALLNPPFSMASRKGNLIEVGGYAGRCSIAMAHLLVALARVRPQTCCAIVPESLLSSEMDQAARDFVSQGYLLTPISSLRNSTFRGGRANAIIVKAARHVDRVDNSFKQGVGNDLAGLSIIRGGLPVFQSLPDKHGLPYIHSTDLSHLVSRHAALKFVRPLQRGVVIGSTLLIPRVGIPLQKNFKLLNFESEVQLSDCVIALCFQSRDAADWWRDILYQRWDELIALYRGTGARYITVSRLRNWLAALADSRPS